MFCGPTGVGKTHVCKTLATTFFGSSESMIRLDMSEFMEKHTVSKLIGAPPGYVGYGEGGTLTEAVRRRPYSLVLFDEVEKAHPDVFNMMLQLLDDGRLTDSKGRTVSFANTMVVMTSNLGSRSVTKGAGGSFGLGFGTSDDEEEESYAKMRELVMEDMKAFFRPEFINRLDEMIVFRQLSKDSVRKIAEVEFHQVLARLSESNLDVSLTQAFKDKVVEMGYDPAFGARPLRRAISTMLEDTLAEHLLETAGADDEEDVEQPAERRTVVVDVDAETGKATVQSREKSMA
jgi:ATP-dependent Clp protease ATP-binding subunit ClpC